ncbi:MAG: MoxR family ATPase [Candidatus Thiodiazotropha sp.]|jgi:MoxR-like ATPase
MNYDPVFFDLPPDDTFAGEKYVEPYVFTEDIAIAIDVAHITGRPLLVEGKPGCGKSRLAEALAAVKGWHYLNKSITSRTTLEDLTNEFDHLQRLHDAHAAGANRDSVKPDWEYNRPGIFWWAFNRESAQNRGKEHQQARSAFKGVERSQEGGANHTLLLIDEIDKAEPDLPNDLLDTIERRRIELRDGSFIAADDSSQTFTIITSNQERALPAAFLRRCVSLYIEEPGEEDLKKIAKSHLGNEIDADLLQQIVDKILDYREREETEGLRVPGTSEFLDTLKVCIDRDIRPDDSSRVWRQVENSILRKKA